MLLHLVKKDFLIAKKYVLLVLVMAVGIPLFIIWRIPQFSQTVGFALSITFSEFMFFQYILLKENQYSKASALLCSAPYKRRSLVQSKYIMFAFVFIYCTLVFWIENQLIPQAGGFDVTTILVVLLVSSAFYGLYMPVQYKLGYEKTKFFFIIIIVGSPYVLPALKVYTNLNVDFLYGYPSYLVNISLLLISLCILLISMFISVKVYSKKELV